jgi:ubiquinone/menaquinone biosynthesis C-methylase UbiE
MGPEPDVLLEEMCDYLNLRPGMRVLDLGCGKGLTSISLRRSTGRHGFRNRLMDKRQPKITIGLSKMGPDDKIIPISRGRECASLCG